MSQKPVNSHIIPKHHLKQFANDDGCIFTYPDADKHTDAQCVSKGGGRVIKNTAVKLGYYSPKIEQILDQKFERRGNNILLKILAKQPTTPNEREFFAEYITSFIYRTSFTEKTFDRLYPKILEQLISVDNLINQNDLIEYYKILTDPTQRDARVRSFWENAIEDDHELIYQALLSRKWWIAEVVGSEYFITSDNPLFFSTANGMADREIQITFPLSKRMALVFDGYQEMLRIPEIKYYPASRLLHNQVDLINIRTANNSTELYFPERDDEYFKKLIDPSNSITNHHIKRGV